RLRRVDPIDPREDATREVADPGEALLLEQRHGLGAAAAHLAVHDYVGRPWTLRDLTEPLRQVAERDERRPRDAGNLELTRLPHVENPDGIAPIEPCLELLNGRVAGRRGGCRGGRRRGRDATELLVVDQRLDRRIVAADRARRIA